MPDVVEAQSDIRSHEYSVCQHLCRQFAWVHNTEVRRQDVNGLQIFLPRSKISVPVVDGAGRGASNFLRDKLKLHSPIFRRLN